MVDREFFEKKAAEYRAEWAAYSESAARATDETGREYWQKLADRAAAYAADYESDLAK
jgi:hypothetical protein